MNHRLSDAEAELVFSAILPNFKAGQNGRFRGAATYRGGDNRTALSVDISNGGKWFDHVTGQGGDVFDLAKLHLGDATFPATAKFVSGIVGRDLLNEKNRKTKRPRHTAETLAKAARFRIGLIWRIEECLDAAKQELWDDRHKEAAPVVQDLTQWLSQIQQWSDCKAADLMKALSRRVPHLVQRCIDEGESFESRLRSALAYSRSVEPGDISK